MFTVIKTNHDEVVLGKPERTQCGGAVKTLTKAYDLLARMRAQQAPGSSNAFSVERV